MDPNNTIRRWLLAVGKKWGIRQAHEYRWADADTHPGHAYFTYSLDNTRKVDDGILPLTTADGSTAVNSAAQTWLTTVQIDVYRSAGGLVELAGCCVAAQHNQTILDLFRTGGCAYHDVIDGYPRDMTKFDDKEINYHQRMLCDFYEYPTYEIKETNGVIDTIEFNLESGSPTWEISKTGFGPK